MYGNPFTLYFGFSHSKKPKTQVCLQKNDESPPFSFRGIEASITMDLLPNCIFDVRIAMTRLSKNRTSQASGKLIHFVSLGCPRNLVDSEVMIGLLTAKGFKPTLSLEKADFIIVNTCGFLEAARNESLDTIRAVIDSKKKGAKVIVTGCLAQLQAQYLDSLRSEIHYILGSGDVEGIVNAVTAEEPGIQITSAKSYLEMGEVPRTISTPHHYAYLKIAEGCRKGCSYCIIPHIKGPLKSKPQEQVLSEFSALLKSGCFEVILIAQDLGDYGKDLGFRSSEGLITLLKQMLKIPDDFRLRLLYVYPDEITDDLIALMKSDSRILPYLDMPIQHINDDILHAMRRSTSKKQIIQIIEKLRTELPKISIRTSLIVGFPGETEAHFDELCQFVSTYKLDNVGIFSYSKEEMSHSATLSNHLPEKVKKTRCEQLSALQRSIVSQRHQQLIGTRIPVLIDGFHPETKLLMVGRLPGQCPEVDPMVLLNDVTAVRSFGEPYLVEITDISDYDLLGKVLKPIKRKEWI